MAKEISGKFSLNYTLNKAQNLFQNHLNFSNFWNFFFSFGKCILKVN